MADDNGDDDEGPVVELGDGEEVDGAPLARIVERFEWPQQKSEIDRREGDTRIRTPGGARPLRELLDDVDQTYFSTQQELVNALKPVIGSGPVPTE